MKDRTPLSQRLRAARSHLCIASAISIAAAFISPAAFSAGTIEIDDTRWVSFGGGLRAGMSSTQYAAPDGGSSTDFDLYSIRLYVSGQAHENVKFTFNTERIGGSIDVLDAIAQFEFSPAFNIWVGRMLTPADRIEMNGPYYGLSWNQYTVPLLPSDQTGQAGVFGRDDGVTFWGSADKFQYAFGVFDGVDGGPNQSDNVLFATRLAYNFLNMEANPAYYTSSTYFGEGGDIFTVGLAYQSQKDGTGTAANPADFSATIVDFLFEKVLGAGAAFTLEGEYKRFDADLAPAALADPDCFCLFDGKSYFMTAAYLLPGSTAMRYQPYLRYTKNSPSSGPNSDLSEAGINFVIRGHNARLNLNYSKGDANLTGMPGADVRTVSFGVQVQI